MTRIENIKWFGSNHITNFDCHSQIFRPQSKTYAHYFPLLKFFNQIIHFWISTFTCFYKWVISSLTPL